ncbi:MAG TPA: hypothetical protein VNU01_03010, partial [Egibacteraceae bacterium]|nr:hypothetical protein [Egibacteraceae bacterium]
MTGSLDKSRAGRRPLRNAVLAAVMLLALACAGTPALAQEACEDFDDVAGANPAAAAVWAEIDAAARAARVPPALLAAVAFAEGYDEATARNWIQFRADGRPIVSFDCGIGMLQLTAADGYDARRLAADWRYNVRAGAAVLRAKWDASQANAPDGLERDERFAENWWAALCRYNGQGAAATAYADRAMAFATDPLGEAAVFTPPLRTLRTPSDVFPAFTPSHWYVVRDGEAILATAEGDVVERRAGFVPTALDASLAGPARPPAPRVG